MKVTPSSHSSSVVHAQMHLDTMVVNGLMFGLFPGDKNFTCQSGWVTFEFHSPFSFDACFGECASANGKPCDNHSSVAHACFLYKIVVACVVPFRQWPGTNTTP